MKQLAPCSYSRYAYIRRFFLAIVLVSLLHPARTIGQLTYPVPPGWNTWSYNILFKSGTTSTQMNAAVDSVLNRITKIFKSRYPNDSLVHKFFVCPCDSTLWNIEFHTLGGAGTTANNPPQPPASPAGSGNGLPQIAFVNLNNPVSDNDSKLTSPNPGSRFPIQIRGIDINSILAIIDTGIDTANFNPLVGRLLWHANGAPTLYDFLPGQNTATFNDDNSTLHGTTVTALALQGLQKNGIYPSLMILKALDSNKIGSTFSVSCALSYAIQHHAKLINASLGYYSMGPGDPILYAYLFRCAHAAPQPIPVIVAAGNTVGVHQIKNLCQQNFATNRLINRHFFYPACFSPMLSNVISVTGLEDTTQPCFYQNYSTQFISVGVIDTAKFLIPGFKACCTYYVPFIPELHEGSSFATPIFAGKLMDLILRGRPNAPFLTYVHQLIGPNTSPKMTTMGYIYVNKGR